MERGNQLRMLFLSFFIFAALLLHSVYKLCTDKITERRNHVVQNSLPPTFRHHSAAVPHHPLDPLTVQELNEVRTILASYPELKASKRYDLHSVVLDEPDKLLVLRWRKGDPVPPRKAAVIAIADGLSYLLTVDLRSKQVIHDETSPTSGYPVMTIEEMTAVSSAPQTNADFNRTVLHRGISPSDVTCLPISSGWFGASEERRRLVKVQCYCSKETPNFYMRPIEGVTVVVDLDSHQVVEVADRGRGVPIPSAANTDYRYDAKQPPEKTVNLRPITTEQPRGRSFTIEADHMIRWANWEFHVKPDPRSGAVISRVRIRDPETGHVRDVMYKGMVSELFVPYMDPTHAWYFKTFMDAGEYGFGLQAMPLDPLNDCPRNAYFMDAVFAAADGTPYVRPNMICVFESYSGDIAWRHSECPITGLPIREVRPKVTLVVRMVASVANYDYIVDWELQTDGVIRAKVGLSGILMVKGTPYTNTDQVNEREAGNLYGTLLSENVIGVVHDHYVTFYLDMDVDGTDNSFTRVRLQRRNTSANESPRRSYLQVTREVAKREKEAQVKLSLYDPSEFHIVNPSKKTRLGNPVGYKVVPGGTAANLLDLEDPPQKRAAFTNNQIWATPYNRSEEWAGGLFVYQSHGDDTLAVWSDRDRRIEDRDIVIWYTLGFHHVPCQEDFPVMPTVSSSFDLKPVNFFERNPILKIRPNDESDFNNEAAAAASA